MKAYNVHAHLGRCDGFLMLPTALQSQIVEQVQSILAEQNKEYEGRADSTSANSGEIATPGQTAQGGASHPIAAPAPASEAVADGSTPGPWRVEKRERDGEMVMCWVAAPDCNGFAYAAEILGDDEYRDGEEATAEGMPRRLADCELIVKAVAAYRATPTPGGSADAPVQQAADRRGVYAWVTPTGHASLVLVSKRPTEHSRSGVLNASVIESVKLYDGCAVEKWGKDGRWVLLHDFDAAFKGEQPVEPSGSERGEV